MLRLCSQGGPEGGERVRTDMVLDALGVHFGNAVRHAQRAKESHDGFMAGLAFGSQLPA